MGIGTGQPAIALNVPVFNCGKGMSWTGRPLSESGLGSFLKKSLIEVTAASYRAFVQVQASEMEVVAVFHQFVTVVGNLIADWAASQTQGAQPQNTGKVIFMFVPASGTAGSFGVDSAAASSDVCVFAFVFNWVSTSD